MKASTALASLLFVAALTGCARREATDDAATADANAETPAESAPPANAPPAAPPPSPEITPVTVAITLSPAAEAQMKATSESIAIEVSYGGDPADGATAELNDFGLIELGKVQRELKGAGTVLLTEDVIDKSKLDQIVGQPQIMINAVSAKKGSAENILACPFYWDTLNTAGQAPVKIDCKLRSEQ